MEERYLIGYKGSTQCVYGKNIVDGSLKSTDTFCSMKYAEKNIKHLCTDKSTKIIYKLVPVKII